MCWRILDISTFWLISFRCSHFFPFLCLICGFTSNPHSIHYSWSRNIDPSAIWIHWLHVIFCFNDRLCFHAEMETHIRENILQTGCTVLEFMNLGMDIGMRGPGMRGEGRVLECILSEVVRRNTVTGKMGFSMFQAHKTHILHLRILSTMSKSSMPPR